MMNYLTRLIGRFSRNIGVDLGTANTLVHVKGKGILLNEPSLIAIDADTRQVLAVGNEAKTMYGRTPGSIIANRPLKSGVIADYDQTLEMLKYFIRRVSASSGFFPAVCIGIPSGVTEVEERAVREAAIHAGASEAFTIEEPHAAALGAGLPVDEANGSMILDIGGGTSEAAVMSLGGVVASRSVRTAGDKLDDDILEYMKKEMGLLIGAKTAEDIKKNICSAFPLENELKYEAKGRDIVTGLPRSVTVRSEAVRECCMEHFREIVDTVRLTLEVTPPELAADIMENGLYMAGGGAYIKGLNKLISKELSIPVYIANDPLNCVVMGAAIAIEEMDRSPVLKKVLSNSSYRADRLS
ncbi:MAG: rod shape-determining protein [Abditibacteriota bacterium]|nr:rod shape-determining protein [Abditibacteriota bacterium]